MCNTANRMSVNMSKESTRKAVENYFKRLDKKAAGPQRKNDQPEKRVEKACLELMKSWGWQVEVYEAKATFSPQQQRWRSSSMKEGTPDVMGTMPDGTSLAVELKAPGQNAKLRDEQREFLIGRIKMNCFACVTDSTERLKTIFTKWNDLRYTTPLKAQEYLLEMLPKKREKMGWVKDL